jgi:hypothetical protein
MLDQMNGASMRIGATATKDPVARAELDRRIARRRIRLLRAAGPRLAFSSSIRIPAVLCRAGAAALRHATLADTGAVRSARSKAIIAVETTSRMGRALPILAVALAGMATLPAILRIRRCVVARPGAAARRAASASAADSTARPTGRVGSSRCARASGIGTADSTRRAGSGVATAGSAVLGASASPAGRAAVRRAFHTQATATLETRITAAVAASTALRTNAALRVASSRLGATGGQEQCRREREQSPKSSKHAVLFRAEASHARPAGASYGAAAQEALPDGTSVQRGAREWSTFTCELELLRIGATATAQILAGPRERHIACACACGVRDAEGFAAVLGAPPEPCGHGRFNKAALRYAGFAHASARVRTRSKAGVLAETGCERGSADPVRAASGRGAFAAGFATVVALATARSAVLPVARRVTARGTTGPSASARSAAAAGLIAAAGAARGRTRRAAATQRRAATGTIGGGERSELSRDLELLRVGATATKNPETGAEVDWYIARHRTRLLRAARSRLAFTAGIRIPAVDSRADSAALRDTTFAAAGAVGGACRKAIITIEATSRIGRALAILAVALARVATLTAVLRIGRCVVARACAAARRAAGASAANSTVRPTGRVGSSRRARGASIADDSTRRVGSSVATAGSAVFGSSASAAGRPAVRGAFDAQATATLETRITAAGAASTSLRTNAAVRVASSRLGATGGQEQCRREREQPPKSSKHAVLFRPQASHARWAGARRAATAPGAEARR